MNLWWLITSSSKCSYSELKTRRCLALGWPEIGPLSKYIKPGANWERRFKTFVQLKGNIAYSTDRQWNERMQSMNSGVPQVFWDLLKIKKGDFVVVMETGSQLTLGQIEVRGIGQVTQDAETSYSYDDNYHHAHQVCPGLDWHDWSLAQYGELPKPAASFIAIHQDNEQLDVVHAAWEGA